MIGRRILLKSLGALLALPFFSRASKAAGSVWARWRDGDPFVALSGDKLEVWRASSVEDGVITYGPLNGKPPITDYTSDFDRERQKAKG